MSSLAVKLCVAVLAGGTLLATTMPVHANHGRYDRHDYREWRSPGNAWGNHRHGKAPKVVVKQQRNRHGVVVHHHYRPAPYYRHSPPRYAPPPVYYGPPVRHYPARNPAIIISVPPIVIPLR